MTTPPPEPAAARRAAVLAALALAAALTAVLLGGCAEETDPAAPAASAATAATPPGLGFAPPEPGTYELPPIQPAADGAVLDRAGRPHRLFDYLGGDYVLMSFIYTRCAVADACPLATRVFRQVQRQAAADPAVAGRLRLVTLSFDPAADTPDAMRQYAAGAGAAAETADEAWSFLTTASQDDLQPILDAYGQYLVREVGSDGRYTGGISHVLKVWLIDPELRVRNIYSSDFLHPALVLADVKTLMLESEGA